MADAESVVRADGPLRLWLTRLGTKAVYLPPGSPWENDYSESFKGKLRDEPLIGEISYTLREAHVLIEQGASTTTRTDRTARWAFGRPSAIMVE